MNTSVIGDQVLRRRTGAREPGAGGEAEYAHDFVGELCAVLFRTFRRRDQRLKGEQYLRGLLGTQGRKSIRNIAAGSGGTAAEQSLHHFISSSTWDWGPVRSALASYLEQICPPEAWVVRSMPIPKAGEHTVGVGQGFDPGLGQTFRGQHAFGAWYASEELSSPVSWRLFLSESWARDDARRRRAEVPDELGEETLEECAVAAVLDSLGRWDVPRRPVVLDLPTARAGATVRTFTDAGLPVLTRVSSTSRMTVADAALPGHGTGALSAQRILQSVRGLRRRVDWRGPAGPERSLVATVRVQAPGVGPGPRREMGLLGEWEDDRLPPTRLWVTNLPGAGEGLLRLTKLTGRVGHDLAAYGEEAGLRDFEGRTYRGWHRHITLASAAHLVAVLADADRPAAHAPARSA